MLFFSRETRCMGWLSAIKKSICLLQGHDSNCKGWCCTTFYCSVFKKPMVIPGNIQKITRGLSEFLTRKFEFFNTARI